MDNRTFPVIDLAATGDNIRRLRIERGLSVKDLQSYFGFEEPRAIYKWQRGESLPTVDNLYALGSLLDVPMDQILVPVALKLHIYGEQQAESCCSNSYWTRRFVHGGAPFFTSFPLSARNIILLAATLVIEPVVHCILSCIGLGQCCQRFSVAPHIRPVLSGTEEFTVITGKVL